MAGNGKLSQAVSDFISIVDENLRTQQFGSRWALPRHGRAFIITVSRVSR